MDFLVIIKAWIVSQNPSKEEEQLAQKRILICNNCEFRKYNKFFDLFLCDKCNCPINKKIFSEERCPLKKW